MKRISTAILLLLVVVCSASGDSSTSSQPLQVETSSGPVIAQVDTTVAYWRDIPYAQAPVGELRWRAPPVNGGTPEPDQYAR